MEKEYLAENAMTTDPFNTADTGPDEMPHHLADHCEHAGVGKACRRCRRKFDAASQWTRDFLYSKGPTDAELDAAHAAFTAHSQTRLSEDRGFDEMVCTECGYATTWPHGYRTEKRATRHAAREAILAARAARRYEENRNG